MADSRPVRVHGSTSGDAICALRLFRSALIVLSPVGLPRYMRCLYRRWWAQTLKQLLSVRRGLCRLRNRFSRHEAPVTTNSKFQSNLLVWPVVRSERTLRLHVVEPRDYRPEAHGRIFSAAITALITPEPEAVRIDQYATLGGSSGADQFDLITFPEAFLSPAELLPILQRVSALESLGCIHVGLRPNSAVDRHLFSREEVDELVGSLLRVPRIEESDLKSFQAWLGRQRSDGKFNLGCLFTMDAENRLRICLHPKLVRSKFEMSPLHENHMTEANLLTLVTLLPTDKNLLSVTLQPLLCSDALHLHTDGPGRWPLEGVNNDADCFPTAPPDRVDIVSVATFTPQQNEQTLKGIKYRTWHQDFLDSFRRAASDPALPRHHLSMFVLSNFRAAASESAGGLSGAFTPVPLRNTPPPFVTAPSWGHFSKIASANRWSTPDDRDLISAGEEWSSLGYMAILDSVELDDSAPAYMLSFTVSRLPREMTRWRPIDALVNFQLRRAEPDEESGGLIFRKQES
jgi:hypothetical protein